MTPDQTLAAVAIIGVLGTIANVWITLSIHTSILEQKLWVTNNFVSKEQHEKDLYNVRENVQQNLSEMHLRLKA